MEARRLEYFKVLTKQLSILNCITREIIFEDIYRKTKIERIYWQQILNERAFKIYASGAKSARVYESREIMTQKNGK